MNTTSLDAIQINSGLPSWIMFVQPLFFVLAAMPYLFAIAGIILVLIIISSGYQMMASKGDPKVFQIAQGKLTTSVLGIVIIFVSYWVVLLVLKFLGINFDNPLIR
ncbi:MAG: hypothetical protein UR39_C0017G0004 [Candidatus Woesebacteria bacterium GW2011_GWA1_33_30]|uniref:Uncharacterized protein n=1 Tax=Candidatus Woesebacteria bacterium GW2011_GWA2_33_28 TaxID=1618561 RepID=A0A0G0CRH5_9BACT|nr:MAG: hypothetical protein UR38_C0015G0004 [Candidatus Woesebacteria bacterium GW2011_GWA2_33_28]KKP46338.1 MAG: hypothetical protein UR39_C0017G0004 [Candidatus Woesebacteria bacterium GW2011_GWA1_33_30]KKP47833.1 MAG: hypothetical protein UR40_C0017G0004 [Microgenomates group bacterium GW2011_GWC1_33_32]KKP51271.1 MAG: hypothetical protein UR44_C0014G0004 [Candidatus Woesebacteria bacterium GW2011_GWB1_33_38]